jgi:hypothetical protein
MGFRDALANMIGGSAINQRIKEAVDAKLKEGTVPAQASNTGGENEDYGYRKITGGSGKSFNPVKQDKMQKICYWLYDMNGLAHRMAERYCDFIVGDGMSFHCKDTQVDDLLRAHWEDEQNDWERKQYQKVKELSIYGEQFLPVFVNAVNGFVRLGYDDPQEVSEVLTKEGNPEIQTAYKVLRTGQSEVKTIKIVNLETDINSTDEGYLTGEAFFFSINAVSNQPRGRSDLLTLADNIDTYEQYLFNRAERADILTRIIYDLEINGGDEKSIRAILKDLPMPKSNEFWGHNEKMKLNVQSPSLGGQDASAEAKLLFNHILAGAGFPPHWFAGGEGLTRATAMQMDLPTKKQLKTRQGYFRWMMKRIFRYCIHQAILAKQLKPEQKKSQIKINLPKIEEKEIEIISSALVSLTNSLVSATEEGWVTKELATKVYLYVLSNIGMEFEEEDTPDVQIEKALESIDPKLREIYCQKKRAKAEAIKNEEEE